MTTGKRVRTLSALLLAIMVVFSGSVPAYAAPRLMPDGNTFDAEYYAANNPDVVAILGTDTNALYTHYCLFGASEGRLPYGSDVVPLVKQSNVTENLSEARIVYAQNENIVKAIDYLNTIVDDSMSEREIVTVLHDDICNKTEYCDEFLETGNIDLLKGGIFTDFETYKNGQSRLVCGGYSFNFECMCLLCGIRVRYVSGNAGGDHAWSRVLLDGIWYYIDVTWDDCLSNKEYFLVPAGTGVFANRIIGRYGVSEIYLQLNGAITGQDWGKYATPDQVIYNRFDPDRIAIKSWNKY